MGAIHIAPIINVNLEVNKMLDCIIVIAQDRASSAEIYQHEIAHCNGWKHAEQHHGSNPRKGYRSPKPPLHFITQYKGKVIDHWVSTDEALRICGSYGCQWFETGGK